MGLSTIAALPEKRSLTKVLFAIDTPVPGPFLAVAALNGDKGNAWAKRLRSSMYKNSEQRRRMA